MRRFAIVWCVLTVGIASAGAAVLRVGNQQLQIGIDDRTGRLVEFMDPASAFNFLGAGGTALWSINVAAAGGPFALEPDSAASFECHRLSDTEPGLRAKWSGFHEPAARAITVEVTVRLGTGDGLARWRLQVEKTGTDAIAEIRFPRFSGVAKQPDEFLAVPAWTGEVLPHPRRALKARDGAARRLAWDYPGRLSLQCVSLYQEGGAGLYLACEDPAATRKQFAIATGAAGELSLEVCHLPENGAAGRSEFALGYDVVTGVTHGGWVAAAERYRDWGTRQRWATESRRQRGRTPRWVGDTALWVWNRGRSDGVLKPAAVLQHELGLPVSVLWHWWHGCAYDAGFPEYLPPREGAESFRRALDAAHGDGLHALIYMNQRLWGMDTASWAREGAERFAVKGPDGTIRREVYNTFTRQACASMCMGTDFWRQKYAGIAEQAVREFGVDGIYMDQACSTLPCYDPRHGHPLGPGTYWMDGFRRLSVDLRARAGSQRPLALAGEGSGEAWLPYLDLMLSLQVSRERYAAPGEGWEPIPFFPAVYHRFAIQFGNYSSLTMPPYDELWPAATRPAEPLKLLDRRYALQFRFEQARAFVWGQQPMLANFLPSQLGERAEEIAYVVRLTRLRQRVLPYLLSGEFLPPPRIDAPSVEADLSRLSIYAGQGGGLTSFKKNLPLVLASAWRAPGGRVGIAIASIASYPLEVALTFEPARYGVRKGTQVELIDEAGRHAVSMDGATGTIRVSLGPEAAGLLEFQ